MSWLQAAIWGLLGGLASAAVTAIAQITAANFRWPWPRAEVGPRLAVTVLGLLVGAVVAAAAHKQMSGEWPALIMGVCAPSVIRRVIEGIEVQPKIEIQPGTGQTPAAVEVPGQPQEGEVSGAKG